MRKHQRNLSNKEIKKANHLGKKEALPKSKTICDMSQGHCKMRSKMSKPTHGSSLSPAKLNYGKPGKASASKAKKSRYLPRTEEEMRPVEKISRPQNRNKPSRERKKR